MLTDEYLKSVIADAAAQTDNVEQRAVALLHQRGDMDNFDCDGQRKIQDRVCELLFEEDLPPPAKTLPERAREIATLVELNAPAVIVCSRIACFVREASSVYGKALDLELGLMLAAIKQGKPEY